MPTFTARISITLLVLVFSATRCSDSASSGGKYDAVVASLRSIAADYASVATVFSIGKNDDNVAITALRVSAAPNAQDPARAGMLVVAVQHGDEGSASDVALSFGRKLAQQMHDGTLTPATMLAYEWTIVPVANISGFEAGTREEHGIDPNRDFPGPCTSNPGNKLASQRRLREMFDARSFAGVVSLHGFIGSMTYPWGVNTSTPHTADDSTYTTAVGAAAAVSGYETGTSLEVVYAANGTFDDWSYWAHGAYTMLVELKSETESDLNNTSDSLFKYFGALPNTPSTNHSFTGSCLGRSASERSDRPE